jgi:iron complex outermembrane receptor protein
VLALLAADGRAQAVDLPRVEVAGSRLRRIADDAGGPLRVLTREEIARSGATSVTDLLQRLPSMQGFQALSDSVGADGNGVTTASLHQLGGRYTLVLLDGQRIAAADSGAVVDLNTLPLAALERVELLGDGASAVYGADAIGGVVNLVRRRGELASTLALSGLQPQRPGGGQWSVALTQGLGDLARDGHALTWSVSHDEQRPLRATQRAVSRSGLIGVRDASGQALLFFNGSMWSSPPNVAVDTVGADGQGRLSTWLNPVRQRDGRCPAGQVDVAGLCYHDYAATVDVQPHVRRDAASLTSSLRLGESGLTLHTDLLLSRAATRVALAPYPADVPVDPAPLFARAIGPWLDAGTPGTVSAVQLRYRLEDLGPRVVEYRNRLDHLSLRLDGRRDDWDLQGVATLSALTRDQRLLHGWALAQPFADALARGTIDPFGTPGTQGDALDATTWRGVYDRSRSTLATLGWRAETMPFVLPGGLAQFGLGAGWQRTGWRRALSDVASDALLLSSEPQVPAALTRDSVGAHTELVLPLARTVELSGALRADRVGAVHDLQTGRTVGQPAHEVTARLALRWQPWAGLLWRASGGTGFRAPDMLQIAAVEADYGVTAGSYACPFSADNGLAEHPYAAHCWPGAAQVAATRGGNPDLRPERSTHATLGSVVALGDGVTVGADVWSVQVRDAVQDISERLILADPVRCADLYALRTQASTGAQVLAVRLLPVNLGRLERQGVDWQATWRHGTPWGSGRWIQRLEGTWLLRSRYTEPVSGEWVSSLGRFGLDDQVAFRHVVAMSSTLDLGAWRHLLRLHWRSGYADQPHDEADCAVTTPDGLTCVPLRRRVASHWTLDWVSSWQPAEGAELSVGITNLFDRPPPQSLRNTGAHMLGFDPRYASAQGRSLHLGLRWRF